MYTAILIMLGGMLLGRLLRPYLSRRWLGRLVSFAIFLMLFLLGVSLGTNELLFRSLPSLGTIALVLMLCCVAGSIMASWLVQKLWFATPKDKREIGK